VNGAVVWRIACIKSKALSIGIVQESVSSGQRRQGELAGVVNLRVELADPV